jgi:prevent-host-death family protein
MKAVVSLEEFRRNLSDIVSRVMYGDQTVLVQKHSKGSVVVMSEKEYESLRDPRKRFTSQTEWDTFFQIIQKVRARMTRDDETQLDKILDEEIKAVRVEHSTALHKDV